VEAQFLAHGRCQRPLGAPMDRGDTATTSVRSGIALPAGIEMDGIASHGRVSSMNRLSSGLALSLLLGLAWLSLAPVASAQRAAYGLA